MENGPEHYVGLISGTSMDAVDTALVRFEGARSILAHSRSHPLPEALKKDLAQLATPGGDGLDLFGQCDRQFGELLADSVLRLLDAAGLSADAVCAIGSHGQTVRHRPDQPSPFSLQLGDPNVIAQRTGITTVADFRRRDMAAGGEGAPLVPAFHQAVFHSPDEDRVVVNIGGIANVTVLPGKGEVFGYDTGPGNTMLDAWAGRHLGKPRDDRGAWGAQGHVDQQLLERMLADPYFAKPWPKSTGREYFHLQWLEPFLSGSSRAPVDRQATLTELTATTIARSIIGSAPKTGHVLVCGGGVHNDFLMARLASNLPSAKVESTDAHGVDPDWVEAMAFAWLARRTLRGEPGNLPTVTGASAAVVLGGIYPGVGRNC